MIFILIYSLNFLQFVIIIFIPTIDIYCLDIILMISFHSLYPIYGSFGIKLILAAWKSDDFDKLKSGSHKFLCRVSFCILFIIWYIQNFTYLIIFSCKLYLKIMHQSMETDSPHHLQTPMRTAIVVDWSFFV